MMSDKQTHITIGQLGDPCRSHKVFKSQFTYILKLYIFSLTLFYIDEIFYSIICKLRVQDAGMYKLQPLWPAY